MSLSRYKWNVRFGELRAWLNQATWSEEDETAYINWLPLTLDKFEAQFYEQALPYIERHPNAHRLPMGMEVNEPDAMRFAKIFPSAVFWMLLSERHNRTLPQLVALEERIVSVGGYYYNPNTLPESADQYIDIFQQLHQT